MVQPHNRRMSISWYISILAVTDSVTLSIGRLKLQKSFCFLINLFINLFQTCLDLQFKLAFSNKLLFTYLHFHLEKCEFLKHMGRERGWLQRRVGDRMKKGIANNMTITKVITASFKPLCTFFAMLISNMRYVWLNCKIPIIFRFGHNFLTFVRNICLPQKQIWRIYPCLLTS